MVLEVKISNNLAINAKSLISKVGLNEKKFVFISDDKIFGCNRHYFNEFLSENAQNVRILKNPVADAYFLEEVRQAAQGCDFILCLGSGTINDLCKMIAFEMNIPYVIFASAASMNGYLSQNASIAINGHKKTLPAAQPLAVFCDLDILKSAPTDLTKAGIGDAMCFYSCWFDWYLSHLVLDTAFDQRPFEILQEKMADFIAHYQSFSLQDDALLESLIDILLLSGEGMTMAGGSYPASQSEHLIAHVLTMKYPHIASDILHGRHIAVTSLTSASIQEALLKAEYVPQMRHNHFPFEQIADFFDEKIALECEKEFKTKCFDDTQMAKINNYLRNNWQRFREELAPIHLSAATLKDIFDHFQMDSSIAYLGVSDVQYQQSKEMARYIRNRFTCLDFE